MPEQLYKRFRPSHFYGSRFVGGSYTGDMAGCVWSCASCWSGAGGRNAPGLKPYTADQVADKLVAGMRRNMQTACRLSYGEPMAYWEHTKAVIVGVLERTQGVRMKIPGETARQGDQLAIIVETSGALFPPARINEINELLGEDAARLVIGYGLKATHPEALAELTGMSAQTAKRMHDKQMQSMFHTVYNTEIDVEVGFLDRFTDPALLAGMVRELERARPGVNRHVAVQKFKHYPNAYRYYVPKHVRRRDHPDGIPADDEETILSLQTPSGEPRREAVAGPVEPSTEPQEGEGPLGERAALAQTFDQSLAAQGYPDGTLIPE